MAISTLLIEGSFPELAQELAQYIDGLAEGSSLSTEVEPLLNAISEAESSETAPDEQALQKQKDDILKKIITKASALNAAPEREFTAAYNLLINLANQSSLRDQFFARICQYLGEVPTASTSNYAPALAISTLTTIFNILPLANDSRYHVFLVILKVIQATSSPQAFEALIPQLEQNIPNWLTAWQLEEDDVQNLYTTIADVANDVYGEPNIAYEYLLKAVEAIPTASTSTPPSQALAKRTLIAALTNPSITDFTPLTASDAIQALRQSSPNLIDLLDIFSSDDYSSYKDFIADNSLSSLSIPDEAASVLDTKIRLLTLASIAAASPSRSVPYSTIAESLQIPSEEVEIWVIDTIRAGLVEGKLSQLKQEFLVQRATYRVFGEKQWAEIQNRLMIWRRSLENVLSVVRSEKEKYAREGLNGGEEAVNGFGAQRRTGGRRQQGQQQQQQQRDQPPNREIDLGAD